MDEGGTAEPEGSEGRPLPEEEEELELHHPWEKEVRLPRSLVPLHYDLHLHPDLETGLFKGEQRLSFGNRPPPLPAKSQDQDFPVSKTGRGVQRGMEVTCEKSGVNAGRDNRAHKLSSMGV